MIKLVLYTDGGARGNPGPAAIGVVIYDQSKKIVREVGQFLGVATNNQAEYQALIRGLKEAINLNAQSLACYLDSELIVKQVHGKYKVREEGLKPLIGQVLKLVKNFESVDFHHVPREKNKLADKLVNDTLDKAGY
jgi:ribonuclease HI